MKSRIYSLLLATMVSVGMWAVEEGYQNNTLTPDAQGNTIKVAQVNNYEFTIEAQPHTGYIFLYWLDNNSTDNPRTVTMTEEQARQGDFEYKALFGFQKAIATSQGTVTVSTVSAEEETFRLTVTPGSCAEGFSKWSNNKTETTIDYVPTDGLVTPLYNHLDMIYQNTPATQGHIDITDQVCGFKLTAVPEEGYQFAYWGDDYSTNPVRTITYEQIESKGGGDAEYEAHFTNAVVMAGGQEYATISAALEANQTDISVFADLTDNVVIAAGKVIVLNGNGNTLTGDLTIASGAKLTLTGAVTASNLYLSGQKGESSQLVGVDKLTLADGGHAYFDYTLVPGGSANTSSWYGFAVPFKVNIESGIIDLAKNAVAVPESDIRLTKFDGNERATTGAGWTKNYLTSGTLEPGQFYMMTLNSNTNTWRFESTSNVLSSTSEITLSNYTADGAAEVDKGWNSLANPMFSYANASTTAATNAYIYNNETGSYQAYPIANYSYVVGSPLFLQVGANPGNITFAAGDKGENARFAPAYEPAQELSYTVSLSNNAYTDYLYLRASEDATATYERGRDLQKLTSSKVPQLWTVAYGENLAVEDAQLINNEVTYFLEMNAPKTGFYTLSATGSIESPLYLVKDGQLIWNLSESAYEIGLNKGINYGYMLQTKTNPGSATGTNVQRHAPQEGVYKFIYQNNLYILREGTLFNAQGVIVK